MLHRLYYGYVSDILVPLGAYFILCLSEASLWFVRDWQVKSALVFGVASAAEVVDRDESRRAVGFRVTEECACSAGKPDWLAGLGCRSSYEGSIVSEAQHGDRANGSVTWAARCSWSSDWCVEKRFLAH